MNKTLRMGWRMPLKRNEKVLKINCGLDCLIRAGEVRLRTALEDDESDSVIEFLQDDLEALRSQVPKHLEAGFSMCRNEI